MVESGGADTDATPNVIFTNDGDVTDSSTNADAANYGPAAATDGVGPRIISAVAADGATVQQDRCGHQAVR